MLNRANRSAVLALCALGVLVAGFSWMAFPADAQADDLSIRFDEVEAYARAESPRVRILAQELMKLKAKRDDAVQWSNPEIAYDHEDVDLLEWQVTVRKRFLMPFSQSKLRGGWADRVRSTELLLDQQTSNLLGELKAGYVRLRLLDAYLVELEQLREIVTKASAVADARYSEGELSGVERHLIHLSVLSLDAGRQNALQERREVAARWRADIGIQNANTVDLVTPIVYKPVALASTEDYVALLTQRPGVQSQVALQQALSKQAEAARPSLIPGIEVYAGYKRFDPVLDGFVAGVALSLPLFDRNAGAARQLEAERRIVENELALSRTRSAGEIATLVLMIEDVQQVLSTIPIRLEDKPSVMSSLFVAYQSGRYTLEAFLNATQIEVTGARDYYDQLDRYYQNIFRLEAMTGTEIVSFGP